MSTRSGNGASRANASASTSAGVARAVDAGSRDDLKWSPSRNAPGSGVRSAPPSRWPRRADARGPHRPARPDRVEEAADRRAAGGVRRRGRRRSRRRRARPAHRGQGVVHGRADDPAGQVALGHGGADLICSVTEAGHDPVRAESVRCRRDRRSPAGAGAMPRRPCLSRPYRPRWRDLPLTVCRIPRPPREVVSVPDVAILDPSASIPLAASRYHGDQAAEPGHAHFRRQRSSCRTARPGWYSGWPHGRRTWPAIPAATTNPRRYRPSRPVMVGHVRSRTADRNVPRASVLPNLRPTLAAVIAPSFTEPAVALRSAGVRVQHVVLEPPFAWQAFQTPDDADLVVVGNPTTRRRFGTPASRSSRCADPGGTVVVDEAFADFPFPASRNRWPTSRCRTCWCCQA